MPHDGVILHPTGMCLEHVFQSRVYAAPVRDVPNSHRAIKTTRYKVNVSLECGRAHTADRIFMVPQGDRGPRGRVPPTNAPVVIARSD